MLKGKSKNNNRSSCERRAPLVCEMSSRHFTAASFRWERSDYSPPPPNQFYTAATQTRGRKTSFCYPLKWSLALAPSSFLLRYEIKDMKAQQMEILQPLRIGPEVTFCCCTHMQHHSLKGRRRISPSGGSKRAGSRLQYKEGPL